jgi:hypothetical protein
MLNTVFTIALPCPSSTATAELNDGFNKNIEKIFIYKYHLKLPKMPIKIKYL